MFLQSNTERRMGMKLRKNWRNYLLTSEQAEEMEVAYILFEEDKNGTKNYDLTKGIFSELDVAIEYAEAIKDEEKQYVANYKDYVDGNYDYLYIAE